MCKQVHDAGKCEAFNELASLLRSKVGKNDLTPMLQSVVLVPIGLPQLAEPAVDADYLFAFAGEVKWPEDREIGFVNTTEIVEGNDGSLIENEAGEVDAGEYDGYLTEVSASSWGPNETHRPEASFEPRSCYRAETELVVIPKIRQTEKEESRSHGCH
ncbi:hypothetical protein PHMEG_00030235 [Phytophthora megakarya]|uniref:Uncharacterized protein n=1 Tax=Phytophthora megakarya TaxID=4795 RepID=A0A225V394_9STRA|nr:hypothetical protein PHMEG_00030235 [Phytophthora megakarya]